MSGHELFAIVLAAGKASRFGATKQLAIIEGTTLVARAIRRAESVCGDRSVLVTGMDWQAVAAASEPLCGYLVVNSEYEDGISGSLKAGIAAVSAAAGAVLLMLADQPLVTTTHLRNLVATWHKSPDSIIASAYSTTTGPPVIFPRAYFSELLSVDGDRGAKSVLDANSDRLLVVEFEAASIDIDHPDDLAGI